MEKNWWIKFIGIVAATVLAAAFVYPSIAQLDPKTSSFPVKQKITLGLDLQGGLYMVLGVNFDQVYKNVAERQAANFASRMKEKGVGNTASRLVKEGATVDDPRALVTFDDAKRDQAHEILKDEYPTLRLTREGKGEFEVGIAHTYRADIRDKTISQSIEVIRNRIDQFGVTEPSITSQGMDRIVVELPGIKDVERAKELIGRTAKLEFKLVNEKMPPAEVTDLISQYEKAGLKFDLENQTGQKFADYVRLVNEKAKGKIPEDSEIAFERQMNPQGKTIGLMPFLLFSRSEVTGDDLEDAYVTYHQETRQPQVGFQLNPKGASVFGRLTTDHVGKLFAIVLDNNIYSAPQIREPIPGGRGVITLGNKAENESLKEAKDLAIVLRAGALPAQLDFLEQRVVGPSLGSDSIKFGARAGLIGVGLVFLFTLFYYRASGGIAVASLIINVLFVVAILVGLEATLTLPGIAGIALTVGIAVDSNVVIYERIREEMRAGKSMGGAVEAGFQKAFRTIMDSNVTNAAAAIVLLMYGTGPIKGFAVTFLIGIMTTLFTAVTVCKLFFEAYLRWLERRPQAKLSI